MAWSVGINWSTFLADKSPIGKWRREGRCGPHFCIPTTISNNRTAINYKNRNIKIMAATNNCKRPRALVYAKAEEWMKESVVEIVRNLREAPLLVHVYPENTLKTEKRVGEEDWPLRETPPPEGLIFVEQLTGVDDVDKDEVDDVDRAWGIVVQGRGADSGPVCYLLKTSSGPGSGLGLGCTHFCLMRVQNFRETARSQLKNCWLLR